MIVPRVPRPMDWEMVDRALFNNGGVTPEMADTMTIPEILVVLESGGKEKSLAVDAHAAVTQRWSMTPEEQLRQFVASRS